MCTAQLTRKFMRALHVQVGLEPQVACRPVEADLEAWRTDSKDPQALLKDPCVQQAVEWLAADAKSYS
jgi:hypothetical protein